jgi:hypothetical protein
LLALEQFDDDELLPLEFPPARAANAARRPDREHGIAALNTSLTRSQSLYIHNSLILN